MSDYVPQFSLSSSPEVEDRDDLVLSGDGSGISHLVRMGANERDNYLAQLLERLTGRAAVSSSTTDTMSIMTTTNPPAITELVGDNTDSDDGIYLAIMVVGGVVVLWFAVVVVNSIYRCCNHQLLTVDGLGRLLDRVVVALGALLAMRGLPSRVGYRLCRRGEDSDDIESDTTGEESLGSSQSGEDGADGDDGRGRERCEEGTSSESLFCFEMPEFPPSYREATHYSTPRSVPVGLHNPWFRVLDEGGPSAFIPPPGSESSFGVKFKKKYCTKYLF